MSAQLPADLELDWYALPEMREPDVLMLLEKFARLYVKYRLEHSASQRADDQQRTKLIQEGQKYDFLVSDQTVHLNWCMQTALSRMASVACYLAPAP